MVKLLKRREKEILNMLGEAGYEAYFVGGCVRDALRQDCEAASGGDVDIATNAMPEEIKKLFSKFKVVETGIRHGTVTVVMPADDANGTEDAALPVEITTYRNDGNYSDRRHPDRVSFVRNIEEDLARRDFTINAIACDKEGNIVDPYGGRLDIEKKVIRAVGEADKRFGEDALRIIRGLRFASVLGFDIEEETALAMEKNKELMMNISAERVFSEMKKLLSGGNAANVIRQYVDVLAVVLPELAAMKGFEQNNPYHKYDVLEHCIRAMDAVETSPENLDEMRMAALFHDVGKPNTYSMDEEGIGHFYGHPKKSEEIVRRMLHRLKADKATLERVSLLVRYHDLLFDTDERLLKRWMNRLGPDVLQEILEIKLADNFATGNMSPQLEKKFNDIRVMMTDILEQKQCFSLKDLEVSGDDIVAAGVEPGPEVGRLLKLLLEAVIEGKCENDKEALLCLMNKNR